MDRKSSVAAFTLALFLVAPAATPQSSTCVAVAPSNTAFNAALVGTRTAAALPFAAVNFTLSGTQATVTANSLGISGGDGITGISLFQGQPGTSGAQLIQTFSNPSSAPGQQFIGTFPLSPTLISQIQANPSNFFFVLNTTFFPNGIVAGALVPARPQLLTGVLFEGAFPTGNSGSFLLSIGPNNGTGSVTLNFDITAAGLGNGSINFLQLTRGVAQAATFGNNLAAVNGRLTGSTQINSALAQEILSNPCLFGLVVNSSAFSRGTAGGVLKASNEVFIPVAGSARGVNGANFQTDVSLYNNSIKLPPFIASENAFIQFFPSGTNLSTQNVAALNIPSRATTTLRDVNNSLFNGTISGIGALRILTSDSVFANARIYDNQIANGRGTFGQSEPGMFRSQALQQGFLVGVGTVSLDPASGQSFRTNIGFFNPNDTSTTVALEMRESTGTVIGTRLLTLGPLMHTQMPLSGANGLFNFVTGDTGTTTVNFLSGSAIFAYASIVDGVSGDASFVIPSSELLNPSSTTTGR